MSGFFATLRGMATIPDDACGLPWDWPGHSGQQLDVRNALYMSLLDEQAATIAAGPPASEAAMTVASLRPRIRIAFHPKASPGPSMAHPF